MKHVIAILLMSFFVAGCTLGVPIIDDQFAQDNGNAGADSDNDRNSPPERERPERSPQQEEGEGDTGGFGRETVAQ